MHVTLRLSVAKPSLGQTKLGDADSGLSRRDGAGARDGAGVRPFSRARARSPGATAGAPGGVRPKEKGGVGKQWDHEKWCSRFEFWVICGEIFASEVFERKPD